MKFTIKDLKKLNPCDDRLSWYLENIKTEEFSEILFQLNDHNAGWCRWLFARVLSKKERVEIAVFSANLVLHIFEEKYPDDDRPREAIEAAKKYLESPFSNAAADSAYAAAYAAADAAYAAADAAYAAADAAAYAAADAAYAAAYAATTDSAAAATDSAAAAAAYAIYAVYAAAKKGTQEMIINEVLLIIEKRKDGEA